MGEEYPSHKGVVDPPSSGTCPTSLRRRCLAFFLFRYKHARLITVETPFRSGPDTNQKKSVHELFAGAFRNKNSMWIALVFLRKNTRIHKNGRNSWIFRFGPFFGLVCRGDSWSFRGVQTCFRRARSQVRFPPPYLVPPLSWPFIEALVFCHKNSRLWRSLKRKSRLAMLLSPLKPHGSLGPGCWNCRKFLGKCEGSRLVGGTRLVVFPRFLTPYRPKNTTSRDPCPPSSRDPPSRPGPPPPAPIWEGARGKGSRLERGSRLVVFLCCGRFGRGNTTSRVPPTSRDPLPLLKFFSWISEPKLQELLVASWIFEPKLQEFPRNFLDFWSPSNKNYRTFC